MHSDMPRIAREREEIARTERIASSREVRLCQLESLTTVAVNERRTTDIARERRDRAATLRHCGRRGTRRAPQRGQRCRCANRLKKASGYCRTRD